MRNHNYLIKYPRRVVLRKSMTTLGKGLLALLANVDINGKDRLPKKGPIILAGNHVAVLEAVMMAVFNPGIVEFLGTGDIPFDPNYAWIANWYGLIPVNRGNLDRKGLHMGLDILRQNGILGIFPEGGTWDPAQMQAQIGVAWLSYKANAPILPIGFGGIKGGLAKAFQLKRPKLQMNVGELISPIEPTTTSVSLKTHLEQESNRVLTAINALVPEDDLQESRRILYEEFDLEIEVLSKDKITQTIKHQVNDKSAYVRLLYNPVLLDVLVRNLKLPIHPIKIVYRSTKMTPLIAAWQSILDYLEINPGFFTYRFGIEEGLAFKKSLKDLIQLAKWVRYSNFTLTLTPIHRYRNANTDAQVIEKGGCFPKSM